MSILKKIRDRERKLPSPENRVSENAIPETSQDSRVRRVRRFRAPPARQCLVSDCPCPAAIWISIYDRDEPSPTFRCWGCDPPPSASMVASRWLLVLEPVPDEPGHPGRWEWENFPRYRPADDTNSNSLAVFGGDGGGTGGGTGTADSSNNSSDWADRDPTTITAADGSRITIFEPTGWNDLLRLTVKHGADEAWRMLQERTDLKLPVFSELELI
jgi:hypothetical protein